MSNTTYIEAISRSNIAASAWVKAEAEKAEAEARVRILFFVILLQLSPLLLLLLQGCTCQSGDSHSESYVPEQQAVYEAAVELGYEPRLTLDELRALDVIAIDDVYDQCGAKSLACWCETPLCEQILIRKQDVGKERAVGFLTLMSYTLMHEYTHATLPSSEGHGQNFQNILNLAMRKFGLKNETEYLQ